MVGSEVLGELGFELVGLVEAVAAPEGFASLEDDEGGDGADVVAFGNLGVAVNVDLDDVHFVAHLVLDLFEDGTLHLAGAAPCCEKVDEGGLRVGYEFVKFVHISALFGFVGCGGARCVPMQSTRGCVIWF